MTPSLNGSYMPVTATHPPHHTLQQFHRIVILANILPYHNHSILIWTPSHNESNIPVTATSAQTTMQQCNHATILLHTTLLPHLILLLSMLRIFPACSVRATLLFQLLTLPLPATLLRSRPHVSKATELRVSPKQTAPPIPINL